MSLFSLVQWGFITAVEWIPPEGYQADDPQGQPTVCVVTSYHCDQSSRNIAK